MADSTSTTDDLPELSPELAEHPAVKALQARFDAISAQLEDDRQQRIRSEDRSEFLKHARARFESIAQSLRIQNTVELWRILRDQISEDETTGAPVIEINGQHRPLAEFVSHPFAEEFINRQIAEVSAADPLYGLRQRLEKLEADLESSRKTGQGNSTARIAATDRILSDMRHVRAQIASIESERKPQVSRKADQRLQDELQKVEQQISAIRQRTKNNYPGHREIVLMDKLNSRKNELRKLIADQMR